MGLDNGIYITKKNAPDEYDPDKEIIYFRKFWGLRYKVLNYLENKYSRNFDGIQAELDIEDLTWFIKLIKSIDNKKAFENACDGYWEYEEVNAHRMLANFQKKLRKAIRILQRDAKKGSREYLCLWYDSY